MPDNDPGRKWIRWYGRSRIRFDVLLIIFLLVGWSLIYTTATLGLERNEQQWLPVSLVSQALADYSVKLGSGPKLARIQPEIIEAVKRDQILQATPTPPAVALAVATPTFTVEPTATPVSALSALEVNAGGPYSGKEGSEIAVVAENSGSMLRLVPGAITYRWDLNNDGRYDDAIGASTSVLFHDEGVYTITVQATDLLGQTGLDSTRVTVSNVPPSIVMGNNVKGKENQEVIFLATASDPGDDILFYDWDFGDNTPKVTATLNPHHTYLDDGDYTVRLRVSDNDSGVTEASITTEIENLPPIVAAGSDQVTDEGSVVTFNGTAEDPSPLDPLTYDWDFNYDGHTFTPDATGPTASIVYPNGPAAILAALRVRDKDDGLTIDTVKVTVNNVPPVITGVSNDGPVGEGSSLSVSVSATDIGNDPLSYAFDWQNDGSFDEVGQPSTISNIWYNQGDYTVHIQVDDGDGGQAFTTTTVSTLNEPPVAVASAATNILEGSAVAFSGSDSSDPGLNDILTYQWNFGDGNNSPDVNPSHTYADNGVYSATLTVTDDSGVVSTAAVATSILNANPTATAGSDQTIDECRKTGDNDYDCSDVPVNFSGVGADPGTADILTYDWDFDYKNGIFNEDANGATGTYLYPSLDGPADYVVALRVRDDDYPASTDSGGQIGEALSTWKLNVKNLPPWNVSAGGPYNGIETEAIKLTAAAEDAPADMPTLQYDWDLDSNPNFEASGKQVTHTWNHANQSQQPYTIRLRVTDKDGGQAFASAQVMINNAPPTAEANGPYTATVNLPITFSSAGSSDPTNDPLIYSWNFGDGSPMLVITNSVVTTATHLYSDDGVYTAALTVDDRRGGLDTDMALVTITNLPPKAVASANPNPVAKGAPVTFDGSGSTDPDDNPASLSYQWDFGDGKTASGINVSHTYEDRGNYNAMLTVTDDNGEPDSTSIAMTVNNSPPTADAGPDQTVDEGDTVTFDGSNSSDPNSGDSLTYQWNFGDGSPVENGVNVSHIYPNGPATYDVTLTVTDGDGATDNNRLQVTVNNVAPTADAGSDQTIDEGDTLTFDGNGSTDPGPDTLDYQWDFGDGSPVENGANVSHIYPDGPATYDVTLTVTDGDGGASTDTAQIIVNNLDPTARATADQTTVTVGQGVNFDASGSTDPGADTLNYQWDFGDGTTDNNSTVNHSWLITGTYTIILQVDDGDGGSDTDTISVQVN